jgi:hypothetical protein
MVCQGGIAFAPKIGAKSRNQRTIAAIIMLALRTTAEAMAAGRQNNKITVGVISKVFSNSSNQLLKMDFYTLVSKF